MNLENYLKNQDEKIFKNKDYKAMIGGIKQISKEETKNNLNLIIDAIEKLKQNIPIELPIEVFAKSYPHSLKYISSYYNQLVKFKTNELLNLKNIYLTKQDAREQIESNEKLLKKALLMLYAPFFLNIEDDDTLKEVINTSQISLKEIIEILNKYKSICKLSEKSGYNKIGLFIVQEIIKQNLSKDEICYKYNITSKEFDKYLYSLSETDINLEEVKIILEKNNINYNESVKILKNEIENYIKNGITISNKTINFTMLDYYTLTNIPPSILVGISQKRKDMYKGSLQSFVNKNKGVNMPVTSENIIKNGVSFTVDDTLFKPTKEIIDKILNILESANIPNNYSIVYTALNRYAKNIPIIPLKDQTNSHYKIPSKVK